MGSFSSVVSQTLKMTEKRILYTLLIFSCFAMIYGSTKTGKAISVFNIVKFANDVCNGTDNKYGTCYTEQECEEKGGKASGSCAEGYGVCCTFTVGCGDTVSENSTYFESNNAASGACNTKVCRCDKNICQMRLDFTTFQIADPTTATTTVSLTAFGLQDMGGPASNARGRCETDSFSVVVPGGSSPPVICGTNTNQHLYIDVPEDCALLSFHLAAGSSTTRQWNIEVTQFACDYENLAPQGCQQYHFGNNGAGSIESFNFNSGAGIHLANQNHMICIRREAAMTKICYESTSTGNDFAVSVGVAAAGTVAAKGTDDPACGYGTIGALNAKGYDHIIIPQPEQTDGNAGLGTSRFCGSNLALQKTAAMGAMQLPSTVCTKALPFTVRFLSDNVEHADDVSTGFKLSYTQSKS